MRKIVLFLALLPILAIILETNGGRVESTGVGLAGQEMQKDLHVAVTVTAYSPTEEECDEDPTITAYQRPVKEGTIAISRDLEEEFGWQPGDRIHLKGLGVFEVWDRMPPKWKKRVDIFFHDTEKAVSFGIRQAKAIKVERPQRKGA